MVIYVILFDNVFTKTTYETVYNVYKSIDKIHITGLLINEDLHRRVWQLKGWKFP